MKGAGGDRVAGRVNGATAWKNFARFGYALIPLDVAGHEMSHGVTSREANLTYSGESGGLNEGTSDIFGSMGEVYDVPREQVTADQKARSLRYQIMDVVDQIKKVATHTRGMHDDVPVEDWETVEAFRLDG